MSAAARRAGPLLFAALLCSVVAGLGVHDLAWVAGVLFWAAGLLLAGRVRGAQRLQVSLMVLVGALGLAYALFTSGQAELLRVLTANHALLAMLTGVSFLRLISLPETLAGEHAPCGRGALWRTLFGVHLFGAVINLSAVMILGDRQVRQGKLTPLQAIVLSRGFALASHWSPFFAAMGIALSNAPGARLPVLTAVGAPIALFALLLSGCLLARHRDAADYRGYPMHFGALWVPGVLAILVFGAHALWDDIPIITLIAGLALGLTLLVLWARAGPVRGSAGVIDHVSGSLPRMSGELVLFLAAGVLSAGIASAVAASGWSLDLAGFGPTGASVLLLMMVGVSILGVHPVISIATAHGILAPLSPDPDMMGITYLMSWAAGVSVSPFSGMHLAMQGRFGVDPRRFLRWNGPFTLVMLAVDVMVLHAFDSLRAW